MAGLFEFSRAANRELDRGAGAGGALAAFERVLDEDLGHIAHFEELWLTQNLDGDIRFAEMPGMRLTRTQFRRLWDLTPDDAAFVIAELKRSGFLMEAEDGHLRRSDS